MTKEIKLTIRFHDRQIIDCLAQLKSADKKALVTLALKNYINLIYWATILPAEDQTARSTLTKAHNLNSSTELPVDHLQFNAASNVRANGAEGLLNKAKDFKFDIDVSSFGA